MAPPSTDSTLARQLGVILGSSFFPDPYIHSTSNTHQFALSQTSRFFSTYLQSHHLFTSILHWDDLKGLLTDWFYNLSSPVYSPQCSQSNCLTQRLMLTRLSIRSRCHHGPQGPVRSGHCWLSINCSFPSLNCGHPAFVSDKHRLLPASKTFTHHVSSAWNITPNPYFFTYQFSITTAESPSYLK